jgi:leucyl aminopeptidase
VTALTLSASTAASLRVDAVVVGVAAGPDGPVVASAAQDVDAAFDGGLAAVLATLGAKGAQDEAVKLPAPAGLKAPLVLAVGLGDLPADGVWPAEALRRAAGTAARTLAGTAKAALALPVADAEAVGAVALGTVLGGYAFGAYRSGGGGKQPLGEAVLAGAKPKDKAHKAALERAAVLGAEMNRVRDLVNTAPNDLYPASFADLVREAGKEHGLKVEVLDDKALAKGGYGGITGVGMGSENGPRLVRVAYSHGKAKKTLALVGKGITYDSGGLSLKPIGHNETMKCDMAGAAAVLATVVAAARLGLKVNVTGWLALAENMPSGGSLRPGDVLRTYSGRTVEVLNTDAEGRLVMCDAITRACEESPDALVDIATLTGAMLFALGTEVFGVMGNDDALRDAVHGIAGEQGEESWPLPLPEALRKTLDSTVADIKNVGQRMGGGLVAGLYLREFVSEGTPWAHLDIAGPAFNEGAASGYTPKGGTGSGVRTLVALAERIADGQLL